MVPVGRADEHAALRRLAEDVRSRRGRRAVALVGEAGIGKSTLVEAARLECAAVGVDVLEAAGHELEQERPFGVVTDLLLADGVRLPAPGDGAEARFAVVDAVVDHVEARAAERPALLVIEDVHWADAASIVAIDRLVRRLRHVDIGILLTARPSPRRSDLDRLLVDVAAAGSALAVGPLDDREVADLAEQVVGGRIGPSLQALLASAGGNPLFVTELLHAYDADAWLARNDDVVDAVGSGRPPSLTMTVLRRMLTLTDAAVETLRMASVLGETFSVEHVSALTGRPLLDLLPVLQEALDAGLLGSAGPQLRFRHDVVRQAIYEDVPEPVRRRLHVEAARALRTLTAPASTVAAHYALGADVGDGEAIAVLEQTAADAASAAPAVAADLYDHALALVPASDTTTRARLLAASVAPLAWSRRVVEAHARATEALALGVAPDVEISLRTDLAAVVHLTGRRDLVPDQLEHARSLPGFTPEQALRLRAEAAEGQIDRHGPDAVAYDLARLLQEAETSLDDVARVLAHAAVAIAAFRTNDIDRAVDHARLAVEIHRGSAEPAVRRRTKLHVLGSFLHHADRSDEGLTVLRSGLEEAPRVGAHWAVPLTHYMLGMVLFDLGAWDDAVAEIDAGVSAAEEYEVGLNADFADRMLFAVAVHRGDSRRASLLEDRAPSVRIGPATVWQALMTGAADEVDALLRSFPTPPPAGAYVLAPVAARAALSMGVDATAFVDAAERQATTTQGRTASATAARLRCRALLQGDVTAALDAVANLEGCGRMFEAALAREEVALAGAGPDLAIEHLRAAHAVFDGLGASPHTARVDAALRALGVRSARRAGRARTAVSGWDALTGAEARVVTLVAEGLTYQAVAERLFVSRRTVETHVAHVFTKLGVSSRAELAATWHRRPDP